MKQWEVRRKNERKTKRNVRKQEIHLQAIE